LLTLEKIFSNFKVVVAAVVFVNIFSYFTVVVGGGFRKTFSIDVVVD